MKIQNVVYSYNGIVFKNKKERLKGKFHSMSKKLINVIHSIKRVNKKYTIISIDMKKNVIKHDYLFFFFKDFIYLCT